MAGKSHLPEPIYAADPDTLGVGAGLSAFAGNTHWQWDTLFIQLQPQYNYGKLRLILDIFAELKLIQMDVWKETVQRLPVTGTVQLERRDSRRDYRKKRGGFL